MIGSGNSARFTPAEVEEFGQVRLDLGDVQCENDIEQEVSRWDPTLADERFDCARSSIDMGVAVFGIDAPAIGS